MKEHFPTHSLDLLEYSLHQRVNLYEDSYVPSSVWHKAQHSVKPKSTKLAYSIGDLVTRQQNVYDPHSPLMYGVVTAIYCGVAIYGDGPVRFYPELYEVNFGQFGVRSGFFPTGITKV